MDATFIPHVFVIFLTSLVHVVCSSVISPRLVKAWPRAIQLRNVKDHQAYLVLGYITHSLVVGSIALFCFQRYDSETTADSLLPLIANEISLSYFVTELATVFVYFPNTLMEDKPDLLHHVCGIVGLGITLYWQGILVELSIIKLLSQLTIPLLLIRLFLLNWGMSNTLIYLVAFTAMILAHFVLRIAMIPTFWTTFSVLVHTEGITLFVAVIAVVSIVIDVLNFYWLARMVHTYIKYYPNDYNVVHILKKKLS